MCQPERSNTGRAVAQRLGEAGEQLPEHSQPGLLRRPGVLTGEGQGLPRLWDAGPRPECRGVRRQLLGRRKIGLHRHVRDDDGARDRLGVAHLEQCGAHRDGDRKAVHVDDLAGAAQLGAHRDPVLRADGTTSGQHMHRSSRDSVTREAVEPHGPRPAQSRPPGDGPVRRKDRRGLDDALLDPCVVHRCRQEVAMAGPPPPGPVGLTLRGATQPGWVDPCRHRAAADAAYSFLRWRSPRAGHGSTVRQILRRRRRSSTGHRRGTPRRRSCEMGHFD
jgi:hypothetical protein